MNATLRCYSTREIVDAMLAHAREELTGEHESAVTALALGRVVTDLEDALCLVLMSHTSGAISYLTALQAKIQRHLPPPPSPS